MIVELRRAPILEEIDERHCAICGLPFQAESVTAYATTDDSSDVGDACPSCIGYLGNRNPELFPTLGEYEHALRCHPEPVWPSREDALRAHARDEDAAYEATFVS
jgi:hypothetical protein